MTARKQQKSDDTNHLDPLVLDAAARLDVREVDIFVLAHRWWFGAEPLPRALERTFAAYMFGGRLPPWVRHYARTVLAAERIDGTEGRRLCLDELPAQRTAPRHGRAIVAGTCAVFLVFFAAILSTTYDPQTSAPMASAQPLSCAGGGPGLRVLEEFAYGFAGRARPDC